MAQESSHVLYTKRTRRPRLVISEDTDRHNHNSLHNPLADIHYIEYDKETLYKPIKYGTITFENEPYTLSINFLSEKRMRTNDWMRRRAETDQPPLTTRELNTSARRWGYNVVRTNSNPVVTTVRLLIQSRYSIEFAKSLQKDEYVRKDRNHCQIKLSLMNCGLGPVVTYRNKKGKEIESHTQAQKNDRARLNIFIKLMANMIEKDAMTSLENGNLKFDKTRFPAKYD